MQDGELVKHLIEIKTTQAKQGVQLDNQDGKMDSQDEKLDKLERTLLPLADKVNEFNSADHPLVKRVASLENSRSRLTGGLAVLTTIGGLLEYLFHKIFHMK